MNMFDQLEQAQICRISQAPGGLRFTEASGDMAEVDLTNLELSLLSSELRAIVKQASDPKTPMLNKLTRGGVLALEIDGEQVRLVNQSSPDFSLTILPENIIELADQIDQNLGTPAGSLNAALQKMRNPEVLDEQIAALNKNQVNKTPVKVGKSKPF